LRAARFRKGSLDLDMTETKIFCDAQGYAERAELITNDESHQLVEEFMLAANESVAKFWNSST
jgi:ribonuclease R